MPRQIMVEELRDMLKITGEGGEGAASQFQFVDVREEDEVKKARIDGEDLEPSSDRVQRDAAGGSRRRSGERLLRVPRHGLRRHTSQAFIRWRSRTLDASFSAGSSGSWNPAFVPLPMRTGSPRPPLPEFFGSHLIRMVPPSVAFVRHGVHPWFLPPGGFP